MKMIWIKSFKVFESNKIDGLKEHYGDIISKMDNDMSYVKEVLLELEDIEFSVSTSFTPLTLTKNSEYPMFMVNIYRAPHWLQFYDEDYPLFNKQKDFIDSTISHMLRYLEQSGYKLLESGVYKNPTDFKFLNKPTNYSFVFTIKYD